MAGSFRTIFSRDTAMESKTTTENDPLDLVWGCKNIAAAINKSERETFHLLTTKKLPAKKVWRALGILARNPAAILFG